MQVHSGPHSTPSQASPSLQAHVVLASPAYAHALLPPVYQYEERKLLLIISQCSLSNSPTFSTKDKARYIGVEAHSFVSRIPSLSNVLSLPCMIVGGPMAVCLLGFLRLTALPRLGSVTTMTGVAPYHTCSGNAGSYTSPFFISGMSASV